MTTALMDLVIEQQESALSDSFRLLQGVLGVPRMLRRAGLNRGFATPHRVVYTEGPMRVLQFHRECPPVWAEPLLICSAPVSRPYFLDLTASRSVVQQMLAAGFDTYLIDWGVATAADRGLRLCDLAEVLLKSVVQFIRKRSRMPHFHLMGYCLGGTIATIFTALYPSVVKDLVLMSAPIDLGGEETLLKAWANQECFDVDSFVDAFGNCPGALLQSFFALLDPVGNLYGKFGDLALRMHDEEFVESQVALQQWANAQVSVAGGVFRDVVELLYQRNLLARGQLAIHDDPVRLDRITCAVLLLTATADRLVTAQSTMGLVPLVCSRDVKWMSLEGGHESLAVSSKAHQTLWPEAAQWIADHSTPRTGPWIRPGEDASGRPEFIFAEMANLPFNSPPESTACLIGLCRAASVVRKPVGVRKVTMNIQGKCAIVTGAASGIGQAVALELAERGARAVALVDRSDNVLKVARMINDRMENPLAEAMIGDATDEDFRSKTFDLMCAKYGPPAVCVPAAGITRDQLAVKVNKQTGKAEIYPIANFRQVLEVNLVAPVYWAMEMIARIAEHRKAHGVGRWQPSEGIQGTVIFIGSISSSGIPGQVSYSSTKAALEGAAATLGKEAVYHGVRCAVIHPGFTDTPMVRALGQEYIEKNILPYTQLKRLIDPAEIADAIYFMICNSAVSGELWADAGWHPPA